jgi:hypothetical protein
MTCTREELIEAAPGLDWAPVNSGDRYVDIYRAEPYSIMVHFSRDGMVINAHLFRDPPDTRQQLPPRVLAEVDKFTPNKRRRIRSWMYDYKKSA